MLFGLKFSMFLLFKKILFNFRGPSSDCGAGGQNILRNVENKVEFQFRASQLSNNGTDVDMGQIPEIYYRVGETSAENKSPNRMDLFSKDKLKINNEYNKEPSISLETLFSINYKTFEHLYRIFEWALKVCFNDVIDLENGIKNEENLGEWKKERAAYIAIVALRVIRYFIFFIEDNEYRGETSFKLGTYLLFKKIKKGLLK